MAGLRVEDVPEPRPGPGQVVVEVHGASVNFVDALFVTGVHQIHVPTPFTPGNDIAGVVCEVGDGCDRFQIGDRVHGMAFFGGFAERVAVDEGRLRPTPEGLPALAACAAASGYRTAFDVLATVGAVRPGEHVVVLGAAGAVGSAAIQVASVLGARVIACASSPEKLAFCRSLGADCTVDYVREDLKAALKALCPGGVDVVVDLVGGELSEPALRTMGYGGRYVVVGFASGEIPSVPLNLFLLKGMHLTGYEIVDFERHEAEAAVANRDRLEALLVEGRLVPPITRRFPLEQAPAAVAAAIDRAVLGKVVLEVDAASCAR